MMKTMAGLVGRTAGFFSLGALLSTYLRFPFDILAATWHVYHLHPQCTNIQELFHEDFD